MRVEYADGEITNRAYRRNGGKRYALLFADDFELFANLFAPVNAGDYFIEKYSLFHLFVLPLQFFYHYILIEISAIF